MCFWRTDVKVAALLIEETQDGSWEYQPKMVSGALGSSFPNKVIYIRCVLE
jgi:hypothetical protein